MTNTTNQLALLRALFDEGSVTEKDAGGCLAVANIRLNDVIRLNGGWYRLALGEEVNVQDLPHVIGRFKHDHRWGYRTGHASNGAIYALLDGQHPFSSQLANPEGTFPVPALRVRPLTLVFEGLVTDEIPSEGGQHVPESAVAA